jgi:MFS family permease
MRLPWLFDPRFAMRWRIVPFLMVFAALAHFNRLSISVAGADKIIREDFISETQMGFVYTAWLLLYTLFMTPGGWFIDRFGPRLAWMVVGFGSAAGAALTGLAGMAFSRPLELLFGLLVVRSLMGVFNAPLHPSAARLVGNWIGPAGASLANGLVNGTACVGMALTYIVFGLLIDAFDWPMAFLISAGVTALVSLVWTFTASDYPPELAEASKRLAFDRPLPASEAITERGPSPVVAAESRQALATGLTPHRPGGAQAVIGISAGRRSLELLSHGSLLCLTLSYAMVGYFQYLFFYWAQYYFGTVLHLSKEIARRNASILSVAMGVGMVVGGFCCDWMVKRFGWGRGLAVVPVAGLLLSAGVTVLGVFAPDPTMVLVSFAIAMAAVGLGEGAFWTAAIQIGGRQGGTAAGILNTGGNAGGLLAPVLTPFISKYFGWQAGLGVASLVCLAGAVLWWGVGPAAPLESQPPAEAKSP